MNRRRREEALGVVPGDVEEASNSRKRENEGSAPFLLLRHLTGPCFLEDEIVNDFGCIGSGTQGEVRKVEIGILGVCAVKKLNISKGRFGQGSPLNDEILLHQRLVRERLAPQDSLHTELQLTNDTKRELEYTQEVAHHPNIVGFYGYLQKRVKGDFLYYGLIMEYMEGGSVADVMKTYPLYLTEGRVVSYALDIARALAACHTKYRIMHRDVTPSNVFLTAGRRTAKLGDFGYAKKPGSESQHTNKKGTITYMAPEMMNEENPLYLQNYEYKPDVWSFAMFVYAMAFKRDPFTVEDLKSTQRHRDNLFKGERPTTSDWPMEGEGFKDGILDVISKGWATDPKNRRDMMPTVQELREMAARIQPLGENL